MKIHRYVEVPLKPPASGGRAGGLHLSDVIRGIALNVGVLDRRYEDSEPDAFKMVMGVAWESVVFPMHKDLLTHPGEVDVEGIPMTPDAVSHMDKRCSFFVGVRRVRPPVVIVHEVKLTWKSSARDIAQEFMWMSQLKGYCLAFDTRFGVLHVGWVNGDYRGKSGFYATYEIEFTELELKENWHMIKRAFSHQGGG